VLGIARGASEQEVKSAYRKVAMSCHPDRHPGDPHAEERFKEASEAYAVLADPGKRAQYDRFGHAGVSGVGGMGGFDPGVFQDFHDIFGDFFGFGDIAGGGRRRSRVQRGSDVRKDVTLSFEDAAFGAALEVQVRRYENCDRCGGTGAASGKGATACSTCGGRGQIRYQQGFFSVARTCSACQGTGSVVKDPCTACRGEGRVARDRVLEVKVPPGVEDGTRIRYAAQGDAGGHGGPAGDLYIVLSVKEHAFFEREGGNLYCRLPVSYAQAALGAEVKVPTLEGEQALKIPAGTQSGSSFRLRGKGIASLNGGGKGDLYVRVQVHTPTKLSKRQRELLRELEEGLPVENRPERASLLDKVKDIFSS
jgi:molecular chaperone DnaJ